MHRNAMDRLLEWKTKTDRKPMIVQGARQVGKTWLMKQFGKDHYKRVAYINFENNQRMADLFEGNLEIKRLLLGLEVETGMTIDNETLIIFDEVQEVPRALTALKYFNEDAPEYDVLAAGSLLGIALKKGTSFPVGKVEFMKLFPLNFEEYLMAVGEERLIKIIDSKDLSMIESFRDLFIENLKCYYFVGGMPASILTYIESKDFEQVRQVQEDLLDAYQQDFSKHAPNDVVPKIRMIWNSIVSQLSKENKKFVYGNLKKGARAREYEWALQWLIDAGMVSKVNRVSKPGIPLKAYEDLKAFKLYILDVGLLGAMAELPPLSILEKNRVFEEFKGSLTEQFVFQQLQSTGRQSIFYWSAEKSKGEIDFILQHFEQVIPIEVKAEENLQAKSLKSFVSKYESEIAIRCSMSNYRKEQWLINIPLYLVHDYTGWI